MKSLLLIQVVLIECACLGSIAVAGVVFDVQARHPWPCQVITAGYP